MFRGVFAQDALDVGGVFGAFEIGLAETDGAFEKVDVAIDKAGQDQLSASVDDLRGGAAQFCDFNVIADDDDFSAADRHRAAPKAASRLRV